MPQTKFVLAKALKLGLNPIVVINKADKPEARVDGKIDEIFDLFALDANEKQLDFPVIYASGKEGWAVKDLNQEKNSLDDLLNLIIEYVPKPKIEPEQPFAMLATILEADNYLGAVLTGKVYAGKAAINMPVKSLNLKGEVVERSKLTKLFTFSGIKKVPVEEVVAGDIITIAGMPNSSVADTICDVAVKDPIATTPIDPPTMEITLSVNNSPFAGQDGDKVTSRGLDRLIKEANVNVSITYKESDEKDAFIIGGRGELQ